ncbi:MAG: hypothetical protein WBN57_12395 [Gammaproteobacteria bacterium]
MQQLTIRTSQDGWLSELAKAYKDQTPILVIDDGNVGIDPSTHTLFDMGRKADLTTAEITAVCVSCGMGIVGVGMVVLAFFDPEPTTKLALLIASGAVLSFTGGWSAIHILTKKKPPNIRVGANGIEIAWS